MSPEENIKKNNIILPQAPDPVGAYAAAKISGNLIFISGQVSQDEKGLITGVLGDNMSLEEGYKAARCCAISLVAQLKNAAGGDLNRVKRVVKLGGFVNCDPKFTEQPKVINGASDFLVELFGERGKHARTAVGCNLPLGVAVEIDGIFEIS